MLVAAPADAAPKHDNSGDSLPPGAVCRVGSTRLRHPFGVLAMAFAPDGRFLATVGAADFRGTPVAVWDAATGRAVARTFVASEGRATPVLAFGQGETLFVTSRRGSVVAWDWAKDERRVLGGAKRSYSSLAITAGGAAAVRADHPRRRQ